METLRVRLFHYSFIVVIIFVCLAQRVAGGKGFSTFTAGVLAGSSWRRWTNDPADARFPKAYGEQLKADPGDTVVMSLYPNSRSVMRPWHWFYTIAPGMMLRFQPTKDTVLESVYPRIFDPAVRYRSQVLMNRQKKPGHIGLVGSLVAYLMADKKLYFHPLHCSAKHYVEYLSLGSAEGGRWYQPLYNSVSRKCPIRNQLKDDMLDTIYLNKSFELKASNGSTEILRVLEWPEKLVALYRKLKADSPSIKGTFRFSSKAV